MDRAPQRDDRGRAGASSQPSSGDPFPIDSAAQGGQVCSFPFWRVLQAVSQSEMRAKNPREPVGQKSSKLPFSIAVKRC